VTADRVQPIRLGPDAVLVTYRAWRGDRTMLCSSVWFEHVAHAIVRRLDGPSFQAVGAGVGLLRSTEDDVLARLDDDLQFELGRALAYAANRNTFAAINEIEGMTHNLPRWPAALRRGVVVGGLTGEGMSLCHVETSKAALRAVVAAAGPGPRRVDLALGVPAQVLRLELLGARGVLPQRVGSAMQERAVPRGVKVLELPQQVGLGEVVWGHTGHVVLLRSSTTTVPRRRVVGDPSGRRPPPLRCGGPRRLVPLIDAKRSFFVRVRDCFSDCVGWGPILSEVGSRMGA